MNKDFFIVSCEHASQAIPSPYNEWVRVQGLPSHLVFDAGALDYAEALAQALDAPLFAASVSRLVIDTNRSVGHPDLFGPTLRQAPYEIKQAILNRYYLPHRARIVEAIESARATGRRVIHFAAHSFTPVMKGAVRSTDIGLLYDPGRRCEKQLSLRWQASLRARAPRWRTRRNYPYRGITDGLPTALRKQYKPAQYLGFEIEINQRLVRGTQLDPDFKTEFVALTREVFANL